MTGPNQEKDKKEESIKAIYQIDGDTPQNGSLPFSKERNDPRSSTRKKAVLWTL